MIYMKSTNEIMKSSGWSSSEWDGLKDEFCWEGRSEITIGDHGTLFADDTKPRILMVAALTASAETLASVRKPPQ
jgi:hypothetical protein